jgi:redox-sensitive bicupin YhaK (pirin superfamily)
MLTIRRDQEIHREEGGWFTARWHFSFADYRDPANDGFGAMRVFNDDRLVPGAIWPMHPHQDVEGLTTWSRAASGTRTRWAAPPGRCRPGRCSG